MAAAPAAAGRGAADDEDTEAGAGAAAAAAASAPLGTGAASAARAASGTVVEIGSGPAAVQICLAAAEGASVEYSGFTWPAGRVLAELLWRRRAALQTRARQAPVAAVELGAGTGLPSVLLALVGGARRIVATDWARAPAEAVLATAVRSGWQPAAAADGVGEPAVALEARRLGWGGTGGLLMNSFELVLGADVFYEPSQYDSVLASACALLRPPPHAAQFLVAYRDRGDLEGVVRAAQGWGFHVQQLDRRRAEEEAEVILLELTLLSIPYD